MKQNIFTKLALKLADGAGKTGTFYFLVIWMLGWILLASAGIGLFAKDKYPFAFLLFLGNLVQLWYLPLLQIKQVNDSKKHDMHHAVHMQKLADIHASVKGES